MARSDPEATEGAAPREPLSHADFATDSLSYDPRAARVLALSGHAGVRAEVVVRDDTIAVVGTVVGVATSLGFGVSAELPAPVVAHLPVRGRGGHDVVVRMDHVLLGVVDELGALRRRLHRPQLAGSDRARVRHRGPALGERGHFLRRRSRLRQEAIVEAVVDKLDTESLTEADREPAR